MAICSACLNKIMTRCFLALGSNLGDRQAHLRAAIEELSRCGVQIVRGASIYSTEPKELRAQPWFLNTVVEAETELDPEELLDVCLDIEKSRKRTRSETNGPRTLDIDIILFGDRVVQSEAVTIPHPRYTTRRFVLEPLAEIAPDVIDPVRSQTIGEIFDQARDSSSVERFAPPLF